MSLHMDDGHLIKQLQPPTSQDASTESTPLYETVTNTSTSTSSLDSKNSTATSVLSRISKSLKRKIRIEKKVPEREEHTFSSTSKETVIQKHQSISRIPILKSRQKIISEQTSDLSITSGSSQKSFSFFQKLLVRSTNSRTRLSSNPDLPTAERNCLSYTDITKNRLSNYEVSSSLNDINSSSKKILGDTFLNHKNVHLNVNTIDGVHDVIELIKKLQDSETHLIKLISKYITNETVEEKLVGALTNHAKMNLEAERRAQNLAHEMWLQEAELMKSQEIALKESLYVRNKQNRELQEEIENLRKKNEQIWSTKLRQFPEFMRQPASSTNSILIENLGKNNNQLRDKLSKCMEQVEKYDRKLQIAIRENQGLKHQLRSGNSQTQSLQTLLQKLQMENQLESSSLTQQLENLKKTIKESVEAADILLEDLDSLKRQTKEMSFGLNWTKFKSRGKTIPDLIYMCRSCINELAKELSNKHTELVLKEKDKDALQEDIQRMRESLQESKSGQERLTRQLKDSDCQNGELKKYMEKCTSLEHELGEYKQNLERAVNEFEKEKVTLISSIEDMDKLNKKVIEKEEELILSREQMCEYKSENDALRMQVHGLKQVLSASGAGDVARELADTQEKMTFFQSQYYQLLSEKNYLIEQLQTANGERETLNQFQNNYYEFMQVQQQDLEALNKDNMALKEKLEIEKEQGSALRLQRATFQEEKNVMRQIYQRLKSEIDKGEKLQGEITRKNIEASRLSIIAEYNKQLSEKLQCEVAERDVKISELEENMEKLNNTHLENTKDKVALCVELSEACSLNDKLNSNLVTEQQNAVHLDENMKQLENSASFQLRALQEMQKTERAALKELLKDFKLVVSQRDNLMVAQNGYIQQISALKEKAVTQRNCLEKTRQKHLSTAQNVENLDEKLKKSKNEVSSLQRNCQLLEDQIGQLKGQVESLESSKSYLQNAVQKLHTDLDEARKVNVETKSAIKKNLKKADLLQSALNESNLFLQQTTQDNGFLRKQINNLTEEYEQLRSNYSKSKLSEEALEKEIGDIKRLLSDKEEDNKKFTKLIAEKDIEIIELQECSKKLSQQISKIEKSEEEKSVQSKLLLDTNKSLIHLQNAFANVQLEHNECSAIISALTQENKKLRGDLKNQVQEMETNYLCQQGYVEKLIKEHSDLKEEMEADLISLSMKLQETKEECNSEKDAHAKLLALHKDLAYKLLECVRLQITEKTNREKAEVSATDLSQQIVKMSAEKCILQSKVETLEQLEKEINDLTSNNNNLQQELSDLQVLYRQSQARLGILEDQLEAIKKRSGTGEAGCSHYMENETCNKAPCEEKEQNLQEEIDECRKVIRELKINISNLQQKLTVVEFQKCETSLRLHEIESRLKTEQNINGQLTEVNNLIVAEIIKMEREQTMEFISRTQLQKYENILKEIDSEHKRTEELQHELEAHDNNLISARIATDENIKTDNIFKVNLKIFDTIFDVHYIYNEKIPNLEFEAARKLTGCQFYVIQISVSSLFKQKLLTKDCIISITIKNSQISISKSVTLNERHVQDCITSLVPFERSTEAKSLFVKLYGFLESLCYSINIATIDVDISYYFQSRERGIKHPLIAILQHYRQDSKLNFLEIPTLEYNFKCKCTSRHLFESLVKNCYHRLKVDVFSAFTSENVKDGISVPFSISNKNDTIIRLDNINNNLSFTANADNLHLIKKYFIQELNCQTITIDKTWLIGLASLKQYIRSEMWRSEKDVDNLKILYEELRKLISNLPI